MLGSDAVHTTHCNAATTTTATTAALETEILGRNPPAEESDRGLGPICCSELFLLSQQTEKTGDVLVLSRFHLNTTEPYLSNGEDVKYRGSLHWS